MTDNPHRLPATATPSRYELEIRPDLEAASFEGTVRIAIDVAEPTSTLVLHALDLEIDAAWISLDEAVDPESGDGGGEDPIQATAEFDAELERVTFSLAQELVAGPATLHVRFRGVLNDQLLGFYRSTFTSTDPASGEQTEHTLAVTQFESTHARRAFPCFDEPALKAVFSITLIVPSDLLAVSNSAEISRTDEGDGWVRLQFADTMIMSTYLVAFVIGPLEATEVHLVQGVDGDIPLRIVFPPGSAHLCDFALEVADAGIRFYESYYDVPYPGDKVDLVAVPDFAFGAMENLGCITFREVLLLVDPEQSTQPELQRVADVINHELAHMWFGDLVTMKWWNGIWLNEAFATFMEVTASNSFRPEWDVWTTFGLARAAAFDTDSLRSTRPIEYEVISAADAEGMFDILTYEKGASVVRMLEQYLGAEVFRSGITAYLRRHAHSVTETTDLWDALEEVSGEPVRRIMDSWIFRGGYPLVTVEPTDTGVALRQDRFRYAELEADTSGAEPADKEIWPIPVVLSTLLSDPVIEDTPPVVTRLLLEEDTTVELGGDVALVQANVAGSGFYRVNLTGSLRTALAADSASTALERFVLVDDTWAAFYADQVTIADVEELLRTLAPLETDPSVWRRLSGVARELRRLRGDDRRIQSSLLIVELAATPLEQVDRAIAAATTEESDPAVARQQEIRGVLFSLLGGPGEHVSTRERAREVLADSHSDASLRAAAIEVVAGSATPVEHHDLEQHWRDATTPQEELRYLNALIDTDDLALFTHVLDLAATEVRTQNAPYLLRRAISHPTLGAVGWAFISGHWAQLTDRFPSNSLPRMLEGIRIVTSRATADEIQNFLVAADLPSGQRQVDQHLERMWVTVAAAERARGIAVPA